MIYKRCRRTARPRLFTALAVVKITDSRYGAWADKGIGYSLVGRISSQLLHSLADEAPAAGRRVVADHGVPFCERGFGERAATARPFSYCVPGFPASRIREGDPAPARCGLFHSGGVPPPILSVVQPPLKN
jgi:hypothetical protein